MLKRKSALVICLIFALIQSVYTLLFYIDTVSADQWDLIPILELYLSQGDWVSAIFERHGDHFHTSAYAIMLPLAAVSNWNLFWEALALLVFNGLAFLVLYRTVLKQLLSGNEWSTIIFAIVCAMYFSLAHGGNLLWTWQLAVYMALFGMLVACCLLSSIKLNTVNLFIAAVFGLIASFSFSCGFAVWPAGFVIILLREEVSLLKRIAFSAVWALIALAMLLFFLSVTKGDFSQNLVISVPNTTLFLLYSIGTPLAYFSRDLSLIVGAIGLLSSAYLVTTLFFSRDKLDYTLKRIFIAGVGILIMGLVSSFLISLGRLELGLDQSRSFRYIIFSQMFWMGLLLLLWVRVQGSRPQNFLSKALKVNLGFLILLVFFNGQKIGRSAIEYSQELAKVADVIYDAAPADRKALIIESTDYPEQPTLGKSVDTLEQYQLNIYRK